MKTKPDCKKPIKERENTMMKYARDERSDTIGGLFNAQVLTLQKWHEYQTNQPNRAINYGKHLRNAKETYVFTDDLICCEKAGDSSEVLPLPLSCGVTFIATPPAGSHV